MFMTSPESVPQSDLLLKKKTRDEQFTVSNFNEDQRRVMEELQSIENENLVNVHGPPNSGKTFFGRSLASENNEWSYSPWVPTSSLEPTKIVVDNVAPRRIASRRVRELVNFDNADLAVALSEEPIPEIHTSIQLTQIQE